MKKKWVKFRKQARHARESDYDRKIFRLMYILNKLEKTGGIVTKELSDEFNVSLRTVQRDLELLDQTGFPIQPLEEKGRHAFMEGFSLKKAMLTKEEASLLSFLYEIAKSLGGNFKSSFNEILKKVLYKDYESAFYAKIPEGVKLDRDMPFVKELEEAIEERQRVEFYYLKDGKEKWLRVDPLKIVFFDGFWYLVCRIPGKGWIIKLRLENIRKLKILDSHFTLPENIKTMLDESVSIWFDEKRDKKVVVRVDKEIAGFFKQKKYLPLQNIKKEDKDGSLIIESKVCQYMEAIPVILRWLPLVRVLEPKELEKEIGERVGGYLR
jgi:predicted DNA-binding transcriptional regulator YafY